MVGPNVCLVRRCFILHVFREFEESFEKLGPLMFGFHDGQSEAPKIMARKVNYFSLGMMIIKN